MRRSELKRTGSTDTPELKRGSNPLKRKVSLAGSGTPGTRARANGLAVPRRAVSLASPGVPLNSGPPHYRQLAELVCARCDRTFVARPTAKFCSKDCSRGVGPPRLGTTRECAECGKEFYVRASLLGERKFCSRKCFHARSRKSAEALRRMGEQFHATHRGTGNPMWRGRDTEGSIARVFSVRLKGEPCCRNCGSTSKPLHLHHIVPRSMCRAGRRDLRNGVTLCAACHARWHARSIVIYRDILTPDEWAFVSSLELLGQSLGTWLADRYPPRPELGSEARY